MSAVAQRNDLLASIDAVYASAACPSGQSFDAPSAASVAVAVPAPEVRRSNPAVVQLDRLESLLREWIATNDAWAY